MLHPESFAENETHKVLWDFEIQTDHLISDSWFDILIVYKESENLLTVSVKLKIKLKEREKIEKYLEL